MPSDQQGTGKHPHKSTEEPFPHRRGENEKREGSSRQGGQGGNEERSGSGSESGGLKSREYRDDQGNVHHHTKKYEEQHGKR